MSRMSVGLLCDSCLAQQEAACPPFAGVQAPTCEGLSGLSELHPEKLRPAIGNKVCAHLRGLCSPDQVGWAACSVYCFWFLFCASWLVKDQHFVTSI